MENFSKYTPLAIHDREHYVARILSPAALQKRWKLIKYNPNSQISLLIIK